MDFYEVIRARRSIRKYQSTPISEAVLKKILDAARIAPSGSSRQPWKFIVVTDDGIKRDLAAACANQSFIAEAPVAMVACSYNIHYDRGGYMGDMSVLIDVSIAFTHLILAARAAGLGTCWIGAFNNEAVKKVLQIPAGWNVVAVTPLGYPLKHEFTEPRSRKALSEITSFNKF